MEEQAKTHTHTHTFSQKWKKGRKNAAVGGWGGGKWRGGEGGDGVGGSQGRDNSRMKPTL